MGISKEEHQKLVHHVAVLEGRLEKTREGLTSIAAGVAQNLASVKANLDMNSDALEQFDIFNQIWAKMFMRLSERVEQANYQLYSGRKIDDLQDVDRDFIKVRAKEWFETVFLAIKEEVKEEREAYLVELRKKATEEMESQKQAKKEESVAEETLRSAEQTLSTAGGQGSEIPPDAEVFGG